MPTTWLQNPFTQDAINRMHSYVDPLNGTISYSGADFKAIVFLPIPMDVLKARVKEIDSQIAEVKNDFDTISEAWTDLSVRYRNAIAQGDTATRLILEADLRALPLDNMNLLSRELEALQSTKQRIQEAVASGRNIGIVPSVLGDVQTITISTHREKMPVRTLGRVIEKSRTRGPRTFAGSFIFTVFNKAPLYDLLESGQNFYSSGVVTGKDCAYPEFSTVIADQLPPFDVTLVASNELGDTSYTVFYGIDIHNEGMTLSIQDILTEDVMQFTCKDWDPLRPLSDARRIMEADYAPAVTASNIARQSRARRNTRLDPYI
jgi:hypothetical protein